MRRAQLLAPIAAALVAGAALAKLPPLSDEAKAKAAETAAKGAWNDKVAGFKLCQAMDRAATNYRANAKTPSPAIDTPACADPGPYVSPVAAAASGAPAATTTAAAPVKK